MLLYFTVVKFITGCT